jgi:hypothetical protein
LYLQGFEPKMFSAKTTSLPNGTRPFSLLGAEVGASEDHRGGCEAAAGHWVCDSFLAAMRAAAIEAVRDRPAAWAVAPARK